MKETILEKQLKIFLGYIKRHGATTEEMSAVVQTVELLWKYLPIYRNQRKGS